MLRSFLRILPNRDQPGHSKVEAVEDRLRGSVNEARSSLSVSVRYNAEREVSPHLRVEDG